MIRAIAIASQKGGVGKTTTTINVGAALAEMGKRVLLVDLDPQAALTTSLGLDPGDGKTIYDALIEPDTPPEEVFELAGDLTVVPASIDLAGAELELINEIGRERILADFLGRVAELRRFDLALVDCPPSLGLLTLNALAAADEVLIPVQCQFLSLRGMELLLATVAKVQARANPRLTWRALPTFYDRRTAHAREVLEVLRKDYADHLVDVPIPPRVGLADAAAAGRSLLAHDPTSDAATAYRKVAEELARG